MKIEDPRRIVVLGASGSGKSTLVNGLREAAPASVAILKRVITLPLREDSDQVENRNVSHTVFKKLLGAAQVSPWWIRELGNGVRHYYGFEATEDSQAKTLLYPANNAMARAKKCEGVQKLLAQSDVVLVLAGQSERARRLTERTPSMSAEEKVARVAEDDLDLSCLPENRAIQVIDTEKHSLATCRKQFTDFVLHRTVTQPLERFLEPA